jgi:hypothetical protein
MYVFAAVARFDVHTSPTIEVFTNSMLFVPEAYNVYSKLMS